MPGFGEAALLFLVFAATLHFVSISLAIFRCRASPRTFDEHPSNEPVTIVRPVCGLDQHDVLTLGSTFELDYSPFEILFCAAKSQDPAVALVTQLMRRYPEQHARLLVGDERPTRNPKLNNLVKAWPAAASPWIIIADSNVLMPRDYISRLVAAWQSDTGLVCSPPIGCMPAGFSAEIECAFLNTYQARWQYAADTIGLGFAQGKTMLWRRETLDAAGGVLALGSDIAEDAAATKLVRRAGLRVRLVDSPFEQPLGQRSLRQVWDRQVRWARLRRATFGAYFVPEVLTGIIPPLAAGAGAANVIGVPLPTFVALLIVAWYLPEALLNRRAGWHFSKWTPLSWLVRDLLIPVVWIAAWLGNSFTWRGTDMCAASQMRAESIRT